jgi:hypothetical protein
LKSTKSLKNILQNRKKKKHSQKACSHRKNRTIN